MRAADSPSGEAVVGSGSTPEPEIDALRIERGERAELLRDDQWGMVRQHDAAGADADCFGTAGDVADDNGGGGTGDAGHVVMFGQPKTIVAPDFGVLGEIERVAQRICRSCPLRYGREVKNGKGNHV